MCQRLVCQKREFTVRSSSYDPKLKNEFFLRIPTLKKYRFLTKIKLRPPIETVWSLNFRASMSTLYVKNKMAETSLLPKKEGKKFFLSHSRVFLLDF